MKAKLFEERLRELPAGISPVVDYQETDRLLLMDLTAANTELAPEILADTKLFSDWVDQLLEKHQARYGIGGYAEHRTIYSRSAVFDGEEEPRRFHLGIDIWGEAGTAVHAPLAGIVHSLGFNEAFGDYGATLILEHRLGDLTIHSLYGHLSLASIRDKKEGEEIAQGDWIAAFGIPEENGHWPPHLHFQLIFDMEGWKGDYPGVCRFSDRERYLANCPDPDLLLHMMQNATAPASR